MRRGDIVIVAQKGVYEGKPRPAVVIQGNSFLDEHPSILVCLVTAELVKPSLFRIDVQPTASNGLQSPSQIMVDKVSTIRRENIGSEVGRLNAATLGRLNLGLLLFIGLS